MDQIQLVAQFNADGSVTFDHLADPRDVLAYNSEVLPISIHLHGKPGIAVSILGENVEEQHMTYEQINRFRGALNAEIARYGHRPLPPDSFSRLTHK